MRLTRSTSLPFAGGGAVRRIVRRNLGAIVGLAVLALAAVVAASLATWTVDDPSLSHATDHAARNVLGFPGAIVSDLLTQLLGLAASLSCCRRWSGPGAPSSRCRPASPAGTRRPGSPAR